MPTFGSVSAIFLKEVPKHFERGHAVCECISQDKSSIIQNDVMIMRSMICFGAVDWIELDTLTHAVITAG